MKPLPLDGMITLAEGREAVYFCNSFTRLPNIIDLAWDLKFEDWLTLLGEQWEACDNISECVDALWETPFPELIKNPLVYRNAMMTAAERSALSNLPDTVTIYRGCYAHNKGGLSWTLSREIAERFPLTHRYHADGQPLLVRAAVNRDRIVAVKLDRGEEEVIAWMPKIITISHIRTRRRNAH